MWGLSLLNNRLFQGAALLVAGAVGLYLYGEHKHSEGRAELASELAIAAAEKRGETSAKIEEIQDEIENASDDDFVDMLLGREWMQPTD